MKAPIRRRLEVLEVVGNQDVPVAWGPGYENLPAMTPRELRRLIDEMHRSGAGRIRIVHLTGAADRARKERLSNKAVL